MTKLLVFTTLALIVLVFQQCTQSQLLTVKEDGNLVYQVPTVSLIKNEKLVPFDEFAKHSNFKIDPSLSSNSGIHNFGFHIGNVDRNLQPVVEEYLMGKNYPPSNWYFAQWKKNYPLQPSQGLETIENGNDFMVKIHNKMNQGIPESELAILANKNGKVIYQLDARQGFLNTVGGSNIFIQTNFDLDTINLSSLDQQVFFESKIRLNHKRAVLRSNYSSQPELLRGEVSGALQAGFPIVFFDDYGQIKQRIFIQVLFADTRYNKPSELSEFRAYYQNGTEADGSPRLEYTATIPVNHLTGNESDFKYSADVTSADLRNYSINLSQLLCYAMKDPFIPIGSIASGVKSNGSRYTEENFQLLQSGLFYKNLRNWKLTGGYFGFESQAIMPSAGSFVSDYRLSTGFLNQIETAYKGDVHLQAQFSDFDIKAGSGSIKKSCLDYYSNQPSPNPVLPLPREPASEVSIIGEVKGYIDEVKWLNSEQITIRGWACAEKHENPIELHLYSNQNSGKDSIFKTGVLADKVREAQVANACKTLSPKKGFEITLSKSESQAFAGKKIFIYAIHPLPDRSNLLIGSPDIPAQVSVKPCLYGASINSQNEAFEWSCNCSNQLPFMTAKNWVSQGNGCYHRTADSFCPATRSQVYFTCLPEITPSGLGWVPQRDGCFHLQSAKSCN